MSDISTLSTYSILANLTPLVHLHLTKLYFGWQVPD